MHFASAELDLASDASSIFRNTHFKQCHSLRWDPLTRATSFTNILSKHENTTARFPHAAAALNQTIASLAVMISLIVDEHSLPASRSYVNVLLTNTDAPGRDQFLLSQNFQAASPYLKVTGGAADALSVKTLQLNLLLPMTGLNYSLASDVAETKTSQWETALLPAGEYTAEVQLIGSVAEGANRRAHEVNWRKLVSLSSSDELDKETVDHGAKVVGCVRLEQMFSLPWIEVDSQVTDTLPLMLREDGSEFEVGMSRSGDVDEPFAASSLLYVRSLTAFPHSNSNNASHGHEERMMLTVLSMTGRTSATCPVKMMEQTMVPLMVTHQHLAYFIAPATAASCGRVNYLAEYVYPDRRRRVMFDFHTQAVVEDVIKAHQLGQLVAQQPGFSEQMVVGVRLVVEVSRSRFARYEPAGVDWVRSTVESMVHAASFESLRAVWKNRLSGKETDQALTLALSDAQAALQQVIYDNPLASGASNSSTYMVEDMFPVIDGFAWNIAWANRSRELAWISGLSAQPAPETTNIPNVPYEEMNPESDDFFGPTVKDELHLVKDATATPAGRRQLALSSGHSLTPTKAQVCNMAVVVDVLQDLNTALAKLARSVAYIKGSIAQLQLLHHRDFPVTVPELLHDIVTARSRLTDDMMVVLVRLYTHSMVLSCSCNQLYAKDEVQPLTFRVEYAVSLQWLASTTTVVQISMARTAAISRPVRVYVYGGKVGNSVGGTYKRFASPDIEDAYIRSDLQYIVFFRQGHATCPKGEWVVVPASSSWKKYANSSSVALHDGEAKVVAAFHDCSFPSEADKASFTVGLGYNNGLLDMKSGYNVSFFNF
eukprot:gene9801-7016_t